MGFFSSLFGGGDGGAGQIAEATTNATQIQREMFDLTRKDLAPYRDYGGSALREYAALWGLGRSGLLPKYASDVVDTETGNIDESGATTDPYAGLIGRPMPGYKFDEAGLDLSRNLGKSIYKLASQPGYDGNPHDDRYIYYGQPGATTSSASSSASASDTNGLLPYSRSMEEARNRFMETPGYQFRMDEGIRALDRSAAARGRLGSGGYGRDLTTFAQGIASDEFNNYANRLAGLAGMGQNAAAQTGTLGVQTGGNIANTLMAGAMGQARATQAANANRASTFGSLAMLGGIAATGGFGAAAAPAAYTGGLQPWMMY